MRRLGVDAFNTFIEGLVETKVRVKEVLTRISQANCKEKLLEICCETIIGYRIKFIE